MGGVVGGAPILRAARSDAQLHSAYVSPFKENREYPPCGRPDRAGIGSGFVARRFRRLAVRAGILSLRFLLGSRLQLGRLSPQT